MKHLKTLGLAAMAVLALAAMVGVSSASAKEFHSAASTNLVSAIINPHVYNLTGAEVACNNITFNGTAAASGTSETIKVKPSYSNCNAFGFLSATVNTAGCEYKFNANTTTMDLEGCTAGGINVVISGCSSFVPNQTGINGITYGNTNTAPNRTMDVKTASNNIKANVTSANLFGCPLTEGGKHNTGKYNGETGMMGATGETFWE
jgi:hypothetical protein